MKSVVPIVLLVALSLILGGVLMKQRNESAQRQAKDSRTITTFSNQVDQLTVDLEEQKQVNSALEERLEEETAQKNSYYTQLLDVTKSLESVKAKAQADAETYEEAVKERDRKIAELEKRNDDYTIQMAALNVSISNLESQIKAAEDRLASAEDDQEFLLNELKRLQDEKIELERKFNNLRVLRDQVQKIKEDMSIAKRLEWVRRGVFGVGELKGAEILTRGFPKKEKAPEFDLDIELRPDAPPVIRNQGGDNIETPQ